MFHPTYLYISDLSPFNRPPGHFDLLELRLCGTERCEWPVLHGTAGTAADRTGSGEPLGHNGAGPQRLVVEMKNAGFMGKKKKRGET